MAWWHSAETRRIEQEYQRIAAALCRDEQTVTAEREQELRDFFAAEAKRGHDAMAVFERVAKLVPKDVANKMIEQLRSVIAAKEAQLGRDKSCSQN